MRSSILSTVTVLLLTASSSASAASPYGQDWAVQFGTTNYEGVRSLADDTAGRYYVAGFTSPTAVYATYLQQLGVAGDLGWQQQPSGVLRESDLSQAMTMLDDRVYIVSGARTGIAPELWSFDASGNFQSTAIVGFPNNASQYAPNSVVTDADGDFVISGTQRTASVREAFLAKVDKAGQTIWTRSNVFPSAFNGAGYFVDVDVQGSIYVAGQSSTSDVRIEKFDANGGHVWSRTFGTPSLEIVYDMTLDAQGQPLVIGMTVGDFGSGSGGSEDAFVLNVEPNGELDWVTQFGGPHDERAYGIDVAPNGHIFVAGQIYKGPDISYTDVIWTELAPNGSPLWVDEFGTADGADAVYEVLVDRSGDVLLGGLTHSSLFGPHEGTINSGDSFVVRFDVNVIPEPLAAELFAACALVLRRGKRVRSALH